MGKVVPLLFLKDLFEVPIFEEEDEFISVIIIRKGEKMAGLVVDSFIGQQEIVLKSFGNYLTIFLLFLVQPFLVTVKLH